MYQPTQIASAHPSKLLQLVVVLLAIWSGSACESQAGMICSSEQGASVGATLSDENAPLAEDCLPFANPGQFGVNEVSTPAVPGGGMSGGNSGFGFGISSAALPASFCQLVGPSSVSPLLGERMRFVPAAPASDLLRPPQAA